ncbi:NACHT domain-containing protein [Allokutzneria oryzae]|uniref:NACHT domain-containing protein n=1 Tax=Allokutzneria oryzae TaxID=1378989 RepID=A0ABV5ZRX0_9PSEU
MHNNSAADVFGNLVQARDIHGDVHLHQGSATGARQRLQQALRAATVAVGAGHGVAVAPGTVLTCARLVGQDGDGLVLVERETSALACVSPAVVPGDELVRLDSVPGSPVLNWRTGGVCALNGADGKPVPVPATEVGREHRDWLDLLDTEQISAGGWRHLRPALRGYLDAVRKADRDHPYPSVRHAAPPLSKIYLTRQATKQADETEHEALERVDADSLLERHPGVQVLGYPGAGKSSLVRHIAATTAASWLDSHEGSFVPVPITADVLSRDRTLPDALADGVVRGLSLGLDRAALVELFRAEPLPGVPWLVLVDGLDEVLEPAARHTVLRKVADHREDPAYRFLVTSRPLDDRGFASVNRTQFPTYVIEPFSDAELHTFVVGWLAARELAEPERAATDFVARVRRTKLHELAHVPLISTMLCLLFAEKPDADLPDNQSQLYREFVSWLVVKLREADARVQLRRRVAPYGPTAESAADALLDRIQDLFQDIAFGHQRLGDGDRDLSLIEHALAWRGVDPPESVPPQEWAEVIADALRISGLLVQRREDWRFLHQTVEEYFAACHLAARHPDPRAWSSRKLLAPQREWPWPHLEVMTFLAARWVESGKDVSRKLGRLLGWRHREHNIGFIAQLVRHGVAVDPRILRRTVTLLTKVVSTPDTPSKQWHDHVGWLWDIDSELAAREVERVTFGDAPRPRRFEAARFLLNSDPVNGPVVTRRFIEDTKTDRTARLSLGKQLTTVNRTRAAELFAKVARDSLDGEIRMQAAEILLDIHLDLGLDTFVALAEDPRLATGSRFEAARIVVELGDDRERGYGVMSGLLSSVTDGEIWSKAAAVLAGLDQQRAHALLTAIVDDDSHEAVQRGHAAHFLVDQFGESPQLLVRLAVGDGPLSREQRVAVALRRGVEQQDAAQILTTVADGCQPKDPYLFTVLEYLLRFDTGAGVKRLTAMANSLHQSDADRLRAINALRSQVSKSTMISLYEQLAQTAAEPGTRFTAARGAIQRGSVSIAATLRRLVDEPRLRGEDRLEAALLLRRVKGREGDDALESLACNRKLRDQVRLDAAVALNKSRRRAGRSVLRGIATDSSVSASVRRRAAELADK